MQSTRQNVTVLRAAINDSRDIWKWRNDELTKRMSILNEDISWEAHSAWYQNTLSNPNRYLYLGLINDIEKIGLCRFDIDTEISTAEVSINLNPQYRGMRFSSKLLTAAITKFCTERDTDLVATIRKANFASIKCFTNSGFLFEYEDSQYNYYRRLAT